ncbi:MAG TPA: hypothetical protein VF656_18115 [Pyrinomonadaceae bacterium]|jgi:hypothetical protein
MKSEFLPGLPELFCWTRFGSEAGEEIEHILFRKEQERLANDGMFLWGIGNALGPSIDELTRKTARPQVVFSPIKSASRLKDVAPPAVVMWTQAEGLDGSSFTIPANSLVTSRYDPEAPRPYHFALVCYSSKPLLPLKREYKIGFKQLRNLRTGRPVGASQVTAVVHFSGRGTDDALMYDVAVLAELVNPYFVRLKNACKLRDSKVGSRV